MGSSVTASICPPHPLPRATRLMMFLEHWQRGSDSGGDRAWGGDIWGFPTPSAPWHSSGSLGLAAGGPVGPIRIKDLGPLGVATVIWPLPSSAPRSTSLMVERETGRAPFKEPAWLLPRCLPSSEGQILCLCPQRRLTHLLDHLAVTSTLLQEALPCFWSPVP